MSAITALTAQNTLGVTAIHAAPPEFLAAQIDCSCWATSARTRSEIGMLRARIVRAIIFAIDRHAITQVVPDPVMVSAAAPR